MKIALLCSGLGNIHRGHEVFATDLFNLVKDTVDITVFKGGGDATARELVIDNIPRNASYLDHIHVAVSPKWALAVKEQERIRIEAETFAFAAIKPLLEGEFDVIHCLEQEVCNILYDQRHLFKKTPKLVFSNGGAIPKNRLPRCDFVQEHTDFNLSRSARHKAFMIPHGVDLKRFHTGINSSFRQQHGIPENAFVVISVGTICYWHKRMDHVIKEVAPLTDIYLVIVGQESTDSAEIKALGQKLMGERIVFVSLPHGELPQAYAAADVFVLGSLFETFGIVYIEAMAMGLPVICTNHTNQRSIVKEGIFIDMNAPGELQKTLHHIDKEQLRRLAERGPEIAAEHYDLEKLKVRYADQYAKIAAAETALPKHSFRGKLVSNLKNVVRKFN